MTKDEALRLALEALGSNRRTHYYCDDTWYSCPKHEDGCANEYKEDECDCGADEANAGIDQAITAIKAALEAKDEPVAWISPSELLVMRGNALGGAKDWRVNVGLKPEDGDVGLYTTPPLRKPLTDEEIGDIAALYYPRWQGHEGFARAIERAHGITGENT